MKLQSIHVENFLGIKLAFAEGLGNTIIIAGQNGSGKSAIFEALRLLKSSYGGYQPGEWQQFFNERQIQLQGRYKNISGIFNDPSKPIRIRATLKLHDDERRYISENLAELTANAFWQGHSIGGFSLDGFRHSQFSAQQRAFEQQVQSTTQQLAPTLISEMGQPEIEIGIDITPSEEVTTLPSLLVNLAFSNFKPRQIGLIDYHGAQRYFHRESVTGINLNLQQVEQNYSQSALYNYASKYNNIKSEMATSFVSELLAEHATGTPPQAEGSITASLKDLFATFFPDKEFPGPQATKEGSLRFPVRVPGGGEHDIDDLSAGEKEILYGYLRMRSSAPRYSIILIDEPELHLNPRLIRKLPEFYRRNLGELLDNQLWLVTHADSLIREAAGKVAFNVFHMVAPAADTGNQLRALSLGEELDAAVADLVGDLASYRPGGRCILVEGGGDAEFDRTMLLALFPSELQGTNVICSANKAKVAALHKTLERAYSQRRLQTKFFAISDMDSDLAPENVPGISHFVWDVYHIENYLIDPVQIAATANIIGGREAFSPAQVEDILRAVAQGLVPTLIEKEIRDALNREIVGAISLKTKGRGNPVEELFSAAVSSRDRIVERLSGELMLDKLRAKEQEAQGRFRQMFVDSTWKERIPGREILRGFVGKTNLGQYERFRNVLLSNMANSGVKPEGMHKVIRSIVAN